MVDGIKKDIKYLPESKSILNNRIDGYIRIPFYPVLFYP